MILPIGTAVYYTGDMANKPKQMRIVSTDSSGTHTLECEDGTRFRGIFDKHIGRVYRGHCSPRFVTAEAVATWKSARIKEHEDVIRKALREEVRP